VNIPNAQLTVSVAGIGGATGTATPSPAGTICGTGCFTYAPGTTVKITATAASGSLFGGWESDCAGQGATCTLTMSADHTAVAHFRPNKNVAFVTSGMLVPGTIGSNLANADAFCASSAKAAFLGGAVWRVWLSTSAATTNINAATHVGSSTTGWIRPDGRPFATSTANLLAGKIYYPLRITELGQDRAPVGLTVVSGTAQDGSAVANGTCADWTSTAESIYLGVADGTTMVWTYEFSFGPGTCGSGAPIYCFENDTGMATVAAPVAPSNGRHAFLSKTAWQPGGGVAAADAVCQGDASAAGLASATNYRALLATTVPATDSTRISLSGQPWYRLDGAQLVSASADLADPAAGKMLTALNVTPDGQYVGYFAAWTGSAVPASVSMTATCNNWTSSSTAITGYFGLVSSSSSSWWGSGNNQPCGSGEYVYCFER
jgi:hypothetical protein